MQIFRKYFLIILLFLSSCVSYDKKKIAQFDNWTANFKAQMLKKNIPADVFDMAFKNVRYSEQEVKFDKRQLKKITFARYYHNAVNDSRIAKAKRKKRKYQKISKEISTKYQVPQKYIYALWGIETDFGSNKGRFYVVNSLANLAFEGRRRKLFENELYFALQMIRDKQVNVKYFKGSWAGAFGQCQFMPTSFYTYAIDHNKDGKKNIWYDHQDIFASIANYLAKSGWDNSHSWGYEVRFTKKANLRRYLKKSKSVKLAKFQRFGLLHNNGRKFTEAEEQLDVKLLKLDDRYFLVTKNFDIIKKWNNSTYFAMTIGLFADQI
jgi:membrane-bound lytic murein transglycosylase B